MGNQNTPAQDKKKSILITVCVILAAVLVIGLTVYTRLSDSGALLRSKTAASSDNFDVSGTMMAYFYNNTYQTYAQYLSYLGADTSVSLKQQQSAFGGGTWFDYFVETTKESVTEMLGLCEGAKAAGVTLDDEDRAEIDASLEQLEETAKSYGYSVNQFLAASTGTGMNLKDVRKCLELTALASKYRTQFTDGLTYTDEQMETFCSENPDSFNGVDYYSYTVSATDFMEKDPNGNPVGETASASAAAEEAANRLAAASSGDEFRSLVKEYVTEHIGADSADTAAENCFTYHALASQIPSVSEWAFDAKAGDTKVVGESGDTSFTVYYLDKPSYRDETKTRHVRHILFTNETYEDDFQAQDVYAQWEAAGFTEEKIAELAAQYSEDAGSAENGGLYEDVARGETVNAFNAWLFDGSRKPGDHGRIESEYGWHIMYYVGEGDQSAWKMNAMAGLKSEDYSAMVEANSANVTYNDKVIDGINA